MHGILRLLGYDHETAKQEAEMRGAGGADFRGARGEGMVEKTQR